MPENRRRPPSLSRRHRGWIMLVAGLVVFGLGAVVARQGPASRVDTTTSWQDTDLLWDAVGDGAGFTAVGNSGVVVTSPDGGQWQQQPRVTGQTLRGVTTDGRTVVAVGTGGAIVSWPAGQGSAAVVHPAGLVTPLLGVAVGNGTWVAGGGGGRIISSRDLVSWTPRRSGTDGDIFAIAYGARRFVAVTDTGSIVVSTDGATWSTTRPADGLWLWGIAYGAHGFVAAGANGSVLQSIDGLRWSIRNSGTKQALRGVAYGNGQYVVTGSDATVISSPDGLTWTNHPLPDSGVELWRPAFSGTTWLAVGAGGSRLTSMNLATWDGGTSTRTAFYGVGSDGGTVLAAGVNGTIARRQPDGSWISIATATGGRELRSVENLGGTWVATGGGGSILTSGDGRTFVERKSGSGAELWSTAVRDLGGGGSRLVVVGAGGAILVSDDRGASWRSATDPQHGTLFSVTDGQGGFVAVGVDGAMVRSTDGITWARVDPPTGQTLRAVHAQGGTYVAVGASGLVLTSTDGVSWHAVPAVTSVTLRAVDTLGGAWVAVGGGGVVIRSADTRTWTPVRSGTDSELFAITATDDSPNSGIAVAGVDASILSTDGGLHWNSAP